ncbi:MAG: DUF262 domain-containing protein [Bacteroides sp.]|nr:DUF262 domain-containing protein [Bacteroides sp.]
MHSQKKTTITLRQFIAKSSTSRPFEIPNYQRGYVWGKNSLLYKDDSVTHLTKSLLSNFNEGKDEKDLFLQGITVTDEAKNSSILLIDGQQRTTYFTLMLKYLHSVETIPLIYSVRKESNKFFNDLDEDRLKRYCTCAPDDDDYQDRFYFRKTLWILEQHLKDIDKKKFTEYILDHVKFIYVAIPGDKAADIFTMMNGQKKTMRQEELIKAELLRTSSLSKLPNGETSIITDDENLSIRHRLAREWDRWLHWWNDEDVKKFFQLGENERQLGWLLPLALGEKGITLDELKNTYFKKEESPIKLAKRTFKDLRLIQKQIEDAYNDAIIYNYIGGILAFKRKDKSAMYNFLKWYIVDNSNTQKDKRLKALKKYFDWSLIGVTHLEIVSNNVASYNEKCVNFRKILKSELLYRENYSDAANWLLRRNILFDCQQRKNKQNIPQGVKFNFAIWNERSLEHIIPKSRVFHVNAGQVFNHIDELNDKLVIGLNPGDKLGTDNKPIYWRDINESEHGPAFSWSEHSIGNLVLFYKNENSSLSTGEFDKKKADLFSSNNEEFFQSRHLLHTVEVFSNPTWDPVSVNRHQEEELSIYDQDFQPIERNDNTNEA